MEDDMREWSWWEMVAQMDDDSLEYVVCDGDRSRGLIACEVRPRPNSYDHKRQVQRTDVPQLREWDFVLIRSDATVVRLHPGWNRPKIPIFLVEGHAEPVATPENGLGRSDGEGTYQKYRTLGKQAELRFGSRAGTLV